MAKRTELTVRQINLIEYIVCHPELPQYTCAKDCGVSRATYYDWKATELFQNELKRKIQEKWKDAEALAVETMISLCREGNFNASKYLLDNFGYSSPQRIDINGQQSININIIGDEEDGDKS